MSPERIRQPAVPAIDPALVATGSQTVAALVTAANRVGGATPIRRSFVQPADRNLQPQGGPLAALVRNRDRRALILFLLVLTAASKPPFNVWRDSTLWARALDLGSGRSGREAISKAWQRLRALNLIEVTRVQRKADVKPLREDGSTNRYEYPDPNKNSNDRYLRLPVEFWLDGWYSTLSLPAIAMLLVLLAEKPDTVLPLDRVPAWYGLSRSTAQRGFEDLEKVGLLKSNAVQRPEPLSPLGFTFDHHRRLVGPFARIPSKPTTQTSTTTAETKQGDATNLSPAPGGISTAARSVVDGPIAETIRLAASSAIGEETANMLRKGAESALTGLMAEQLRHTSARAAEHYAYLVTDQPIADSSNGDPETGAPASLTASQRRRQRRRRPTVVPEEGRG